ncbi:MAG: SRPBCC family protein [Streptosporangiales bacterium]
MTTSTTNQTRIEVDPNLPTIRIVRDFTASPERVYRAWTDPELLAKWLGRHEHSIRIDRWDARTGGNYRYSVMTDGVATASFFGSFHELRPDERIVRTETFEMFPDGVCLETVAFEDLGSTHTRVTSLILIDTLESRDAMIASGMEHGVVEGYEQLDALLAATPRDHESSS